MLPVELVDPAGKSSPVSLSRRAGEERLRISSSDSWSASRDEVGPPLDADVEVVEPLKPASAQRAGVLRSRRRSRRQVASESINGFSRSSVRPCNPPRPGGDLVNLGREPAAQMAAMPGEARRAFGYLRVHVQPRQAY